MSMYADYVRERTDDEILEINEGFATFRIIDEKTCYIVDIYVRPDYRKQHLGSTIADLIVKRAKERGCTKLLGSVVPSNKGSTDSLKVLLAYGFRLQSSQANFIFFEKDI